MIFSTLSESIAFVLCTIDSLLADALTLSIAQQRNRYVGQTVVCK